MNSRIRLLLAVACTLGPLACSYIVLPPDVDETGGVVSRGWSARALELATSEAGDLRIHLAIRNDTGSWSTMRAEPDSPAVLSTGEGQTSVCDAATVGTGGHRLAPGFQMRGYTTGPRAEPQVQLIYVDCPAAEAGPGSTLTLDYLSFSGDYNYYDQQAGKAEGTLQVALDQVEPDLPFPVGEPVEELIQSPETEFLALNEVTLRLTRIERTQDGLQFAWLTSNPGEYPTYVHIGIPPVIGQDGILYGQYETPDLTSVPITGAGSTAEWTTQVVVPPDVAGLRLLLSVETGKQRYFTHQAVDLPEA